MKTICPAGCGKKFISRECAESHADTAHPGWRTPKQRGWATPYGFGDWVNPITYEEACEQMKTATLEMKWPKNSEHHK